MSSSLPQSSLPCALARVPIRLVDAAVGQAYAVETGRDDGTRSAATLGTVIVNRAVNVVVAADSALRALDVCRAHARAADCGSDVGPASAGVCPGAEGSDEHGAFCARTETGVDARGDSSPCIRD